MNYDCPEFEIDISTFENSLKMICGHCKNREHCHPTHICKIAQDVFFYGDELEED